MICYGGAGKPHHAPGSGRTVKAKYTSERSDMRMHQASSKPVLHRLVKPRGDMARSRHGVMNVPARKQEVPAATRGVRDRTELVCGGLRKMMSSEHRTSMDPGLARMVQEATPWASPGWRRSTGQRAGQSRS